MRVFRGITLLLLLILLNFVEAIDLADRFLDAQSLAKGSADTAKPTSTGAAFWNPAGVALLEDRAYGFTYLNKYQVANLLSLDYLYRADSFSAYSFNVIYQEIPGIKKVKDIGGDGLVVGSYQDEYLVANCAAAFTLENDWYLGTNFRIISHSINNLTGSGFAFDTGMIKKLKHNIYLGLTVKDIISAMSWPSGLQESFEQRYILGANFYLNRDLELSLDLEYLAANRTNLFVGLQYQLLPDKFFIRAGLNSLDNFAVGFGLVYQEFVFDLAYLSNKQLDNSIVFSYRYLINNKKMREYNQIAVPASLEKHEEESDQDSPQENILKPEDIWQEY